MKCKYWSKCPHYKEDSVCCKSNKLARNFYGKGRPAGCFRRNGG